MLRLAPTLGVLPQPRCHFSSENARTIAALIDLPVSVSDVLTARIDKSLSENCEGLGIP
jgi:hypothetical protein